MAAFGAGNPSNATIAFSLLGDNAISAGYTAPASALGEIGLIAAVVASMLGDSMPATAITVGSGGTQITKVVVYSITVPATTASTSSFLEVSVAVTGLVTSDKIFVCANTAQATVAAILGVRCSVTDAALFLLAGGNTTGTNTSGVYRLVAVRS